MAQAPIQSVTGMKGLQGLSGGWVISKRGLALRTGLEAQGPAYLVTMWTKGSVDELNVARWQEMNQACARERAVLGQKGAYGKLAEVNRKAESCFHDLVERSLEEGKGELLSDEGMLALAQSISSTDSIDPIAACIFGNHAKVLFMLNGETGVDALVARWKQDAPSVQWAEEFHANAVSPVDCGRITDEMFQIMGEVISPVSAEDDGRDGGSLSFNHVTVLLNEAVDALEPAEGKLIIDATLGGGGHTELLLERGATVWGIDQDPDARRAATVRLARFGSRFKALAGNFREIRSLLAGQGVEQIDGLLADIGVSSHQIDTAERGFSFREDGPLDMRMSPEIRKSAADVVNSADEKELADIIWQYGEERASRAIARAIVKARANGRITTTAQLADIVSSVMPRKGKQHPATRTFQALRIFINDELGALDDLLKESTGLLAEGGRFAVITFHSLEDRRVKQFFDLRSRPEIDRKEWPAPRPNPDYCFKLLYRKPVTAGERELSINPRSRSAKLRAVEKINS